ncbi:MAG: hypothetical protein J5702_02415, partial [Bacteroidales bacterium]|nr:hypothetical protein [Bacteroidales bacterium]
MIDKHALRIGIFNSTLAVIRQGSYEAATGRKVELPPVEDVMNAAVMYREPIALYANRDTSAGAETTISFAMKDGNSSLLSWKHTDLLYQTPSGG